jgi:hypothetical protein
MIKTEAIEKAKKLFVELESRSNRSFEKTKRNFEICSRLNPSLQV